MGMCASCVVCGAGLASPPLFIANLLVTAIGSAMENTIDSMEREYPRYHSTIDKTAPEYASNYAAMKELVDQLNERLETEGTYQGKESHVKRHMKFG